MHVGNVRVVVPRADLVLNGRFLTRPLSGVDRVASELSRALVEILSECRGMPGTPSLRLALPGAPLEGAGDRPEEILTLERIRTPAWTGSFWEQVALGRARRNDWLLDLCNMGPVMRRKQAVMIHDAQVYSQPQTYSRAFRTWYQALLPSLAQRARVLLTVSDFSRMELESRGVFPRGKAVVLHNGVDHMSRIQADPETLARHRLTEGGYFLAIGSLAPHKNLTMLVAAARRRQDRSVPLIVAGGKDARVFQSEGLTDGDGVRFLGHVSDAELKALYCGAMALTFPSKTEGFGLPPLEAMSCGCPVIATTGGAVPEVCGEAALYVAPDRGEDWTAAMTRIGVEPGLRHDLAQAGRARALEFTWRRAALRLLETLAAAENSAAPSR